jgi:predicted dehydrogenase
VVVGPAQASEIPSIGFAGLATSHPYTDASTVSKAHPGAALHVWEPDADRLARFLGTSGTVVVHDTLNALVAARVDGAIISRRPPEVADTVAAFAGHDMPLFINKPAAATLEQLAEVDAVVRPIAARVMSTSVLRFAHPLRAMAGRLDRDRTLSARAVVKHDVGRWLQGATDWQDDPEVGGGCLVTIGIHGLELLVSLLGPDVDVVSASAEVRHLRGLRSEDSAIMTLRWRDGILATVVVVGVAESESYEVILETVDGAEALALPSADADPLGYRSTIEAFLELVRDHRAGRPIASPVPWDETHAILRTIASASSLVHGSIR